MKVGDLVRVVESCDMNLEKKVLGKLGLIIDKQSLRPYVSDPSFVSIEWHVLIDGEIEVMFGNELDIVHEWERP